VSVFIFFYFFRYRITVQVTEEYLWNRYQDILPQIIFSSIEYENKGKIPLQFLLSSFVFDGGIGMEEETLKNFFNRAIGKCFEIEIDGKTFLRNMPEGCERKFFEDNIILPLFINYTPSPVFKVSQLVIKISERWAVKCPQEDYCNKTFVHGVCFKTCYDYPDYAGSSSECEKNVKISTEPC
jgi:hypothetical protein